MNQFKGILLSSLFLLFAVAQGPSAQAADDSGLAVETVKKDEVGYRVKIAEPFIELHTGPAAGYPIFYVIDRGTEVRIVRRKTNWFKIETDDGKRGWASRDQIRQTLLPSGEQFKAVESDQDDFTGRRWVLGVTGGEFDSTPVITIFTGYSFTENLSVELHVGQSTGTVSDSQFIKANMVMQPLPDWRISPYLTLGVGQIETDPNSTLISQNDDSNTFAQYGLGIQGYVTRSFLARFEVNEYVIFSSTATRDDNEVIHEWKFGFAVFF
ncbi:MAG: SH3 domain-containing protein [Gammaproteobacteria bacterium]